MNKREILSDSPLFFNLLIPELDTIAGLFVEREYRDNDWVFREGDVGDSLYVIASGEVDIVKGTADGAEVVIATLRSPNFLGEMSLIDKEFRSASVRARGPTTLLQLSNENLHTFAKHYRNGFTWIVVNIARILSTRLREMNKRLAELSQQAKKAAS